MKFLVVQDTTVTPLAQLADVVLAGATFAEKAGCYVNADGRLQYSEAALPPRDGSLPDLDLLAILLQPARGGPVDSSDGPGRAGRDGPGLRASPREASCRRYGVSLGEPSRRTPRPPVPPQLHRYLVRRPRGGPRAMSRVIAAIGPAILSASVDGNSRLERKDRVHAGC